MKKFLFIISIATFGLLNACTEKLDTTITPQTSTTVYNTTAARISSSIQTNFPSATNIIIVVIEDKKTYSANFTVNGTPHECFCSSLGAILSVYKTTDNLTLPDAIKAYLEVTYNGYKLQKVDIGKDAAGKASTKVMIELNDQKITLIFDDKNVIIATFTEPKNNTGGDKNKVFTVLMADLPVSIQSQLTGYVFIGAVVKTNSDNSKKIYFVTAKKDSISYEFTYDSEGKIVKTESFDPNKKPENKEVKENELPLVIQSYIKINYKDWKFEKAAILVKDKSVDSYSIILSKDKKIIILTFDKDGKFIKVTETAVIQLPKIEYKVLIFTDIPLIIKSYLTTTYTGWLFINGNITLKDSVSETYYVNILVGINKYQVVFDKEGKFLLAKRG